ncbi:MAG: hypothetical protein ACP6IY_10670 [Promethearchaeia archaeon]
MNKTNWIKTYDGRCPFNDKHKVIPYVDPFDPDNKDLIYCKGCDLIFEKEKKIER